MGITMKDEMIYALAHGGIGERFEGKGMVNPVSVQGMRCERFDGNNVFS
jgi:hypothetical protein